MASGIVRDKPRVTASGEVSSIDLRYKASDTYSHLTHSASFYTEERKKGREKKKGERRTKVIEALINILAQSSPPLGNSNLSTPPKCNSTPTGHMKRMFHNPTNPKKRVIETLASERIWTLRRRT